MQLLWMGPQVPSGPQALVTMPVLFTEHGACATWPALVTFQAIAEESSGQIVSPSEGGYQRGLSSRSLAQSPSLGGNPCRLWSLALVPVQGNVRRSSQGKQVRERPASWTSSPTYPG